MIAVIDYGMGNLRSLAKALARVGGEPVVTRDPDVVRTAARIVLPGVGAFGQGMENLRAFGLLQVLEEEVLGKRKPFWGICLGMQLLARSSEEFGMHKGLGWVPGEVRRFAFPLEARLNVPHMGWNTVTFTRDHPVTGLARQTDFYFVHSYVVIPDNAGVHIGVCDYGGPFCAALGRENIVATQFHPEKSQREGLAILKNFCKWDP
jgi:glutamine amidotransferase